MKKKIFLLPILALLLAGCGQPQPTSIEITGAKTVEVDSSIDLTAKVLPAKANQEVSWVSSAPEIAVVSAAGKVTGKAEGTAKITVTSKAKTDVSNFVDITVTAKPVVETPVESVAITTPNGTSVEEGATLVLGKTVLPANANQNVTWESSDKTVATVNNGMVVGVKAGTAEISIASVADVTKTAKVAITVTEKAVVELVVSSFLGADNVGRDAAGLKGHVAYKAENSVFLQDATGILQVFTGYDAGAKEVAVGDYIEVTTGVSQLRYGSTRLAKTEASGGTGAGDAAEIKKIEGGTAPVALTPENMSAVEARAYADAAKTGYVGNKLVKMTDEIEVYLNGTYKNLRFVGETGPYVIASQGTLTAFKPDLETVGNVLEDVVLVLTGANNSSRIDTMVVSYKVKGVDPDVKHTVTFDSDGGSEVAPVEVNDGAKVAKPADPTKDGVSFVEWQLNGVAYDFDTPVTGDITLKAVWGDAVVEHTVTFDTGDGLMIPNQIVEEGAKVTKPDDPTLLDYTFAGWEVDGVAYDFDTPVTGDLTIKALWTLAPAPELEAGAIMLNFNTTNVFDVTTEKVYENYPDATHTVDGVDYKFGLTDVRWLQNRYDNNTFPPYHYLMMKGGSGEITGTAPEGKYVAKLTANFGAGASASAQSTFTFSGGTGDAVASVGEQLKGVTFTAENTNATHTNFSIKATSGNNQMTHLIIVYRTLGEVIEPATEYTVSFDTDGGSAIEAVKVEEGKKVTKPANPTKEGFNFVRWELNGVTYDFDAAVTGDITLKAVWGEIPVIGDVKTLTINPDNGLPGSDKDINGILFNVVATSKQGTGLQLNKKAGYIYNSTAFGELVSVTVTMDIQGAGGGAVTVLAGTSMLDTYNVGTVVATGPTVTDVKADASLSPFTVNFAAGLTYIQLVGNTANTRVSSIVITYK